MIKIAIASGKGGTGKTFVSTNLYRMLADCGKRVGIVDCDAEVPNDVLFLSGEVLSEWPVEVFCPAVAVDKCIHCGLCAEVCLYHAITSIPSLRYIKVMEDLCHACTACLHVCPTGAIISGRKEIGRVTVYGREMVPYLFEARIKAGEHSPVSILREAIHRASMVDFDYLILDAPPGCACPFVHTVKDADLVLLVTEPTPFGLSDLKHTVKVLRQLGKPFAVIVNRADLGDGQMKAYLDEERIELLTAIPYSEQIATAYSEGSLMVGRSADVQQRFQVIIDKIFTYESRGH